MELNRTRPFHFSDNKTSCKTCTDPEGTTAEGSLAFWIVICVLNAVLSFTALFGNSVILVTLWRTSSLHSMANILLASLAVSDFAVGLVVQPLFIAIMLSRISTVRIVYDILSYFLCCASFITIKAITVDRLLILQLHLRYQEVVTLRRVTSVVVFIWVFSGVCSSLLNLKLRFFDIAAFAVIFTILLGNLAVYLKIYFIVRRHQKQIRQQQQQQQQQPNDENIFSLTRFKKTALNTFLVYILLSCCYMPYCFAFVIQSVSLEVQVAMITLIFINSSLNPLLYCWRDRQIRTAVKGLFCR